MQVGAQAGGEAEAGPEIPSRIQSYLEELVEQESEPVGQHLLSHGFSPGSSHGGTQQSKTETEAAGQTSRAGGQDESTWIFLLKALRNLKTIRDIWKLQYFGHLMQRADSLEKTLMPAVIESGR